MKKLTIKIGGLDSNKTTTISKDNFSEIQWKRILQWYNGTPLYIIKNCFGRKQPSTIYIPFVRSDGSSQTLRITPTGLVKHIDEESYVFDDRYDPDIPAMETLSDKIRKMSIRLGVTDRLDDSHGEHIESFILFASDEMVLNHLIRYNLKNDEDVFLNAVNVYMIFMMVLTVRFCDEEEDGDFHKLAMEKLLQIYRIHTITKTNHKKFMDYMKEHRYYEPIERLLKGDFDMDISVIFPADRDTMDCRKW